MFRDVTTLLLDHKAFKDTTDIFVERYRDQKIDVIVGMSIETLQHIKRVNSSRRIDVCIGKSRFV